MGQFGSYRVTYTDSGLAQYEAGSTNKETTEIDINNLYPSTDYTFTVVTVSGTGSEAVMSSPSTCPGRTGKLEEILKGTGSVFATL